MRKYLILTTILYTAIMSSIFGQCPPDDITLTSQEQVDNFASDYPGCTQLQGSLTIRKPLDNSPSDINSLSPLSQITSIAGMFRILDIDNITSLGAFNDLTTVGDRIEIDDNDALLRLTTPNNLISSGGSLSITNNAALLGLQGLGNFSSSTDLIIRNNDNMVNLSILSNQY